MTTGIEDISILMDESKGLRIYNLKGQLIKVEQKKDINEVLNVYGDKSGHWLSELTHNERPWKETRSYSGVKPGDACNKIISRISSIIWKIK